MTKKATESPMMAQYKELKSKHQDRLLLFRCGDFYETYCEDAQAISEILGIVLTRRLKSAEKEADGKAIRIAGFPYHALDTYLPKLVRAGKRVAICDQIDGQQQPKEIVSPSKEEKPVSEPAGETDAVAALKEQMEKPSYDEIEKQNKELQKELANVRDALREAARRKITEIIKTTLLSGVTITANLDNYYASCFDRRLDYILLKRDAKISLNETDIAYLIEGCSKEHE